MFQWGEQLEQGLLFLVDDGELVSVSYHDVVV